MDLDGENSIIKDILKEHLLCAKWFAENQGNSKALFREFSRLLIILTYNNGFKTLHFNSFIILVSYNIVF